MSAPFATCAVPVPTTAGAGPPAAARPAAAGGLAPAAGGGSELSPVQQARLVQGLLRALQQEACEAPGAVESEVHLLETHISWVLLARGLAYKIKKALDLGFLDFATCEARRHCCNEELRLNRRLAAGLYLDVVPITGSVEHPGLGGTGPVLDWAVKMRAFDQRGLWDRVAAHGALLPQHVDDLALQLHAFHQSAAVASALGAIGQPAQVRAPMLENLATLERLCADADAQAQLQRLRPWEAQAFAALQPVFEARLRCGHVRECHGDLHLGNVAFVDGRATVFDCIEFNEGLRWGDVASEIAFLTMDLHAHGLPALAHRFANACLELSGDYDAARVQRWYLIYRALVRAKVAALHAAQGAAADAAAARRYLGLAAAWAQPSPPALMVTHGLAGSGKTSGSQALLEALGVIRVRADVERKRLAGMGALQRSGSAPGTGLYGPEASAATYARLFELARSVLQGGCGVLLDATFLLQAQRDAARQLARDMGVPFVILAFEANAQTLRERVRARCAAGGDASEADDTVLALQQRCLQALTAEERAAAVCFDHGREITPAALQALRERLAQPGS